MEDFSELPLSAALRDALAGLGITRPTPVQAQSLAGALGGRNLVIQSETGSGKTLCYLLPLLERILAGPADGGVRGLIITPTHELASQIARVAEDLLQRAGRPSKVLLAIGSVPLARIRERMKERPPIVVGSAGKVLELIAERRLRLSALALCVLDEADRLLARESHEESAAILSAVPPGVQCVLASATFGARELADAKSLLEDPLIVRVAGAAALPAGIAHVLVRAEARKKLERLRALANQLAFARALVFARSSGEVLNAYMRLKEAGFGVGAIHSSFDKAVRKKAIEDFTKGRIRFLVTSDLGARGLDIAEIDYVVHLDLPSEPGSYIHRAGRTGRAGAKGTSLVLADDIEEDHARKIARRLGFAFSALDEAGGGKDPQPSGTAIPNPPPLPTRTGPIAPASEPIKETEAKTQPRPSGMVPKRRDPPPRAGAGVEKAGGKKRPEAPKQMTLFPDAEVVPAAKKDKKQARPKKPRSAFKKQGGYPKSHEHLSGPTAHRKRPGPKADD